MYDMYQITQFFSYAFSAVDGIDTDILILAAFGGFLAVFAVAFVGTLLSRRLKSVDKRPFFCFVNLFTVLVFAVFLTAFELHYAAMTAALFWCVGYLLYGLLRAVSKPKRVKGEEEGQPLAVANEPAAPISRPFTPAVPAAKNVVRLEHALSIADRLLAKNLGRSDRQELERMKTTLAVLQVKGALSPQENETLNESFNALLKLMAKYNL